MLNLLRIAFALSALCSSAQAANAHADGLTLLQDVPRTEFRVRDGALEFSALISGTEPHRELSDRDILQRQQKGCPAGDFQCDSIHCCPVGSACGPHVGKCCPNTAETCGGWACALAGAVCCSSWVCEPGTQCGSSSGECVGGMSIGTQTPTPTRTSSQISTPMRSSTSTSSQASSSTSPGPCGSTSQPGGTGSSLTNPGFCSKVCNVQTKEEMSVFNVPNVPGRTDELIRSMCAGMRDRLKFGETTHKVGDGEDVLVYNGPNNRQTHRSGLEDCRQQNRDNSLNGINQCDEYPPASFNQNRDRQTFSSIPSRQNSGTQGPMLSNLARLCGLKQDDKVLFKVEGGCSQFASAAAAKALPIHRRDTWMSSGTSTDLSDPFNDASLTYVFVDLGELDDGHYDLGVSFGDQVERVEVLDNSGEVFASQDSPTRQLSLSFDVSDGANSGMALVAYTNMSVSLSYSGSRQLSGASKSDAASSGGDRHHQSLISAIWAVFAATALFVT